MGESGHIPLIEVIRGKTVESVHYGSFAVAFSDGRQPIIIGNNTDHFFLRSSAKPFQALAFLENGGAEHFGLAENEIAIICSSHSGTDEHMRVLKQLQNKVEINEETLQCGLHPPLHQDTAKRMLTNGEALHNNRHNCSGKHTAMLAYAKMIGASMQTYLSPTHPVQQAILETFAEMCAFPLKLIQHGIDGCSAPVFAIPLSNAAQGYARLSDPRELRDGRKEACHMITRSMSAHPILVGGPDRFDTNLIAYAQGGLIAKEGAEGYMAVSILPQKTRNDQGIGICLKISDGDPNRRAASLACLTILQQIGSISSHMSESFQNLRVNNNWRGIEVGELRPSDHLLKALEGLIW